MKKSIIAAGAASVALAAMPIVGVFAEPTTEDSVTDTLTVTVNSSCSFKTTEGGASDADSSYSGNGTNGEAISFSNSGSHVFNVFCNNNAGYAVTASATALSEITSGSGITATFAYLGGNNPGFSGDNGQWHAQFTGTNVEQIATGQTSGTILSHSGASAATGETFTAAYSARVGDTTPAGEYQGTITYTLTTGS